jgi:hypothetical protein
MTSRELRLVHPFGARSEPQAYCQCSAGAQLNAIGKLLALVRPKELESDTLSLLHAQVPYMNTWRQRHHDASKQLSHRKRVNFNF